MAARARHTGQVAVPSVFATVLSSTMKQTRPMSAMVIASAAVLLLKTKVPMRHSTVFAPAAPPVLSEASVATPTPQAAVPSCRGGGRAAGQVAGGVPHEDRTGEDADVGGEAFEVGGRCGGRLRGGGWCGRRSGRAWRGVLPGQATPEAGGGG